MQIKKEYIGIILSVFICLLFVFVGVYATTTVGNDVSVGGTLTVTSTITGSNFSTNDTLYNTFVGTGVGTTTTASYNVFIGYEAGRNNDKGNAEDNVFIGYQAGYNNNGPWNIGIGDQSLYSNTGDSNNAIGYGALLKNTTGNGNLAIGNNALSENTTGEYNLAIGGALSANTTGASNLAMGTNALASNVTGSYNIAIGDSAGISGGFSKNVFIGYQAGYSAQDDSNIFIGYRAGFNETDADKLYIENSDSATPLIYGSFSDDYLVVTSKLGIGTSVATPSYNLAVDGTASISDTMYVKDIYFSGVVSASDANGLMVGGGAKMFGGTASPDFSCTGGSLYIQSGTGNEDTSLYLCNPANTWNAISFTTL